MAAVFTFYDSFKEFMADNTIDMDNDTFTLMLVTSSYTPNAGTHTQKSNVTNELTTANGYTAGGKNLENVVWTRTGGTVKFDADDVVWTASGGSITARYAVLYSDTSANDNLVGYILLDDTAGGTDVTATSGNTLTVQWNSSGIFTLT